MLNNSFQESNKINDKSFLYFSAIKRSIDEGIIIRCDIETLLHLEYNLLLREEKQKSCECKIFKKKVINNPLGPTINKYICVMCGKIHN